MTDDRVEGRYDELEQVSNQIRQIAIELEEVVGRLAESESSLREAWPDRVGTEFTDEVEVMVQTLRDLVEALEDKASTSMLKAQQLRAVHEESSGGS